MKCRHSRFFRSLIGGTVAALVLLGATPCVGASTETAPAKSSVMLGAEESPCVAQAHAESGAAASTVVFPQQIRAVYALEEGFDAETFVDAVPEPEYASWGYISGEDGGAIYVKPGDNVFGRGDAYRRYGYTELFCQPAWYSCTIDGAIDGRVDWAEIAVQITEEHTAQEGEIYIDAVPMDAEYGGEPLFVKLIVTQSGTEQEKAPSPQDSKVTETEATEYTARDEEIEAEPEAKEDAAVPAEPELLAIYNADIEFDMTITAIGSNVTFNAVVTSLPGAVANYGGTFQYGTAYNAAADTWSYTNIGTTVTGKRVVSDLKSGNITLNLIDEKLIMETPIVFLQTQNASANLAAESQIRSAGAYLYEALGTAFYNWFYDEYKPSLNVSQAYRLNNAEMTKAIGAYFGYMGVSAVAEENTPVYSASKLSQVTLQAMDIKKAGANYSGAFYRYDSTTRVNAGSAVAGATLAGVKTTFTNINLLNYAQITAPYFFELTGFTYGDISVTLPAGSGVVSNPIYLLDAASPGFREWLHAHTEVNTAAALFSALYNYIKANSGVVVIAEVNTPTYNRTALLTVQLQVMDLERASGTELASNSGAFVRMDNAQFDPNGKLIGGTAVPVATLTDKTLANLKAAISNLSTLSWAQLTAPYYFYSTKAAVDGLQLTGTVADPIAVSQPIYLLDAVNIEGKMPFREWLSAQYTDPHMYNKPEPKSYAELTTAIGVYMNMREVTLSAIADTGGKLALTSKLDTAFTAGANRFTWQMYTGGTYNQTTKKWSGGVWADMAVAGNPLNVGAVASGTLTLPQAYLATFFANAQLHADEWEREIRCVAYQAGNTTYSYSNTATLEALKGAVDNANKLARIQAALEDSTLDYLRFRSFYYGNIAPDYRQNGDSGLGLLADGSIQRNSFLLKDGSGAPITGLGFYDAQTLIDVLDHIISSYGQVKAKQFFQMFKYDLFDPNFAARGGCGPIYHDVDNPVRVLSQALGGTADWADETLATTGHAYPKDAKSPFHIAASGGVGSMNIPSGMQEQSFFDELNKTAKGIKTPQEREYTVDISAAATGEQERPLVLLFQIQTSWQMFDLLHANNLAALVNGKAINQDLASLYELKKAFDEFYAWLEREGISNVCVGITNFQHNGTYSLLGGPYFSNDMDKLRNALYGWDSYGDCEHIHYSNTALLEADSVLKNGGTNGVFNAWKKADGSPAYSDAELVSIIVGGACEAADLGKPYLSTLSTNMQFGIRTNAGVAGYAGNVSWMDAAHQAGFFNTGGYYAYNSAKYGGNGQEFFLDTLISIYEEAKRGGKVSNVTISDTVREEFEIVDSSYRVYINGVKASDSSYKITTAPTVVDGRAATKVDCTLKNPVLWGSKVELQFDVRAKGNYVGGADVFTNENVPQISYTSALALQGKNVSIDKPVVDVVLKSALGTGGEVTVFLGNKYNLGDKNDDGSPLKDIFGGSLGTDSIVKALEDCIRLYPQTAGELSYQWMQKKPDGSYIAATGAGGQSAQQHTVSIPYDPAKVLNDFIAPDKGFWVQPYATTQYFLHVIYRPYSTPSAGGQVISSRVAPIDAYVPVRVNVIDEGFPVSVCDAIDYVPDAEWKVTSASGNTLPSVYFGKLELSALHDGTGTPFAQSAPVEYTNKNGSTVKTTYGAFFTQANMQSWVQDKYDFYKVGANGVAASTPTAADRIDVQTAGRYAIRENGSGPRFLTIGTLPNQAKVPVIYGEGVLVTRPGKNLLLNNVMVGALPKAAVTRPTATLSNSAASKIYTAVFSDGRDFRSGYRFQQSQYANAALLKGELLDAPADSALYAAMQSTYGQLFADCLPLAEDGKPYEYEAFRLELANRADGLVKLTPETGEMLAITYPMPKNEEGKPRAWKNADGKIRGSKIVLLHYPEKYDSFDQLADPYDYYKNNPQVYSFENGRLDINSYGDLVFKVDHLSPFAIGWTRGAAVFRFDKVDAANTSLPLADAEFMLYRFNGNYMDAAFDPSTIPLLSEQTIDHGSGGAGRVWVPVANALKASGADGRVSYGVLPGEFYTLVETKSPNGYVRPAGQWLLDVTDSIEIIARGEAEPMELTAGGARLLKNRAGVIFPFAGGMGTLFFPAIGTAIIATVALLLWRLNRKKLENIKNIKRKGI